MRRERGQPVSHAVVFWGDRLVTHRGGGGRQHGLARQTEDDVEALRHAQRRGARIDSGLLPRLHCDEDVVGAHPLPACKNE